MGLIVATTICLIALQGVFWSWFYEKYPALEMKQWNVSSSDLERIQIYNRLYPSWPRWIVISAVYVWLLAVALCAAKLLLQMNSTD